MKVSMPVRWKEGMFLRPQHFQQFDLYLQSREANRVRALERDAWGLLHLDVDEDALSNFVVDVTGLRAILPDGSLVDVPGNARIASRSFETLASEVGRPLAVSVGVRAHDDRGPLVAEEGGRPGDARFSAAVDDRHDLDTGRDAAPIERLRYDLRLFLGDEATDGYGTLPLARLVRTGETGRPVRFDPAFSPPALTVAASPVLHEAGRAVVERLSVVLRDLGQMRGGNDPDPLILYYGLSGSLPVLREMVRTGQVHPRQLYHELARLAGALFYRDREGRMAEEVPAYDHREPAPVFLRLRQLIVDLSEIVIRQPYRRCPMEREGDRYAVTMPEEARQPGARFFVEVHADSSRERVPTLLQVAKFSHPGRLETLRINAMPGVPTEPQPGAPPELPVGQTGNFFRLKHEAPEWTTHVAAEGQLGAFILGAPDDLRMNLIVVVPQ